VSSIAQLRYSRGTLVLAGMTRAGIERIFRTPWTFDPRAGVWRTDAMHYARARDDLAARCHAYRDEVPVPPKVHWPRVALPALRADQREAVDAWQRTGRGVVVMPTGTGKTEVALAVMCEAAVATLVVAPIRDLMYQWQRRIRQRLGTEAGVLGDGQYDIRPVTVTTYESACIHAERLGDRFGLVVFDECHHLPGPVRSDAARMCSAPLRLGLTATPPQGSRTDCQSVLRNNDLDSLIGPVVYAASIRQARGTTLADYDVVRIPVHLTDDERRRYDAFCQHVRRYVYARRRDDPRFTWPQFLGTTQHDSEARRALTAWLAKRAVEDRAEEKLRVLEDLFLLHADQPMLVFAGSNAMAREVSLRFLVPCLLNHCRAEERRDVLEGLQGGVYPAVVANRVLDEGVDLPDVKIAVVLGGGRGGRQAQQRLGRVLRKSGAARAVLYEVVCAATSEEQRSRDRRRNEAYAGMRRKFSGRKKAQITQ
jgi:superfamily II DNA or RNA helicase